MERDFSKAEDDAVSLEASRGRLKGLMLKSDLTERKSASHTPSTQIPGLDMMFSNDDASAFDRASMESSSNVPCESESNRRLSLSSDAPMRGEWKRLDSTSRSKTDNEGNLISSRDIDERRPIRDLDDRTYRRDLDERRVSLENKGSESREMQTQSVMTHPPFLPPDLSKMVSSRPALLPRYMPSHSIGFSNSDPDHHGTQDTRHIDVGAPIPRLMEVGLPIPVNPSITGSKLVGNSSLSPNVQPENYDRSIHNSRHSAPQRDVYDRTPLLPTPNLFSGSVTRTEDMERKNRSSSIHSSSLRSSGTHSESGARSVREMIMQKIDKVEKLGVSSGGALRKLKSDIRFSREEVIERDKGRMVDTDSIGSDEGNKKSSEVAPRMSDPRLEREQRRSSLDDEAHKMRIAPRTVDSSPGYNNTVLPHSMPNFVGQNLSYGSSMSTSQWNQSHVNPSGSRSYQGRHSVINTYQWQTTCTVKQTTAHDLGMRYQPKSRYSRQLHNTQSERSLPSNSIKFSEDLSQGQRECDYQRRELELSQSSGKRQSDPRLLSSKSVDDRRRSSDSSSKRKDKLKDKEKDEFLSPLNSLYNEDKKHSKTGLGYGLQSYKIPKRTKDKSPSKDLTKVDILPMSGSQSAINRDPRLLKSLPRVPSPDPISDSVEALSSSQLAEDELSSQVILEETKMRSTELTGETTTHSDTTRARSKSPSEVCRGVGKIRNVSPLHQISQGRNTSSSRDELLKIHSHNDIVSGLRSRSPSPPRGRSPSRSRARSRGRSSSCSRANSRGRSPSHHRGRSRDRSNSRHRGRSRNRSTSRHRGRSRGRSRSMSVGRAKSKERSPSKYRTSARGSSRSRDRSFSRTRATSRGRSRSRSGSRLRRRSHSGSRDNSQESKSGSRGKSRGRSRSRGKSRGRSNSRSRFRSRSRVRSSSRSRTKLSQSYSRTKSRARSPKPKSKPSQSRSPSWGRRSPSCSRRRSAERNHHKSRARSHSFDSDKQSLSSRWKRKESPSPDRKQDSSRSKREERMRNRSLSSGSTHSRSSTSQRSQATSQGRSRSREKSRRHYESSRRSLSKENSKNLKSTVSSRSSSSGRSSPLFPKSRSHSNSPSRGLDFDRLLKKDNSASAEVCESIVGTKNDTKAPASSSTCYQKDVVSSSLNVTENEKKSGDSVMDFPTSTSEIIPETSIKSDVGSSSEVSSGSKSASSLTLPPKQEEAPLEPENIFVGFLKSLVSKKNLIELAELAASQLPEEKRAKVLELFKEDGRESPSEKDSNQCKNKEDPDKSEIITTSVSSNVKGGKTKKKTKPKAGSMQAEGNSDSFKKSETSPEVSEKQPKEERRKKNELEKLHEDIREMFISNDVVTATGQRSCRMRKESKDMFPPPKSRPGSAEGKSKSVKNKIREEVIDSSDDSPPKGHILDTVESTSECEPTGNVRKLRYSSESDDEMPVSKWRRTGSGSSDLLCVKKKKMSFPESESESDITVNEEDVLKRSNHTIPLIVLEKTSVNNVEMKTTDIRSGRNVARRGRKLGSLSRDHVRVTMDLSTPSYDGDGDDEEEEGKVEDKDMSQIDTSNIIQVEGVGSKLTRNQLKLLKGPELREGRRSIVCKRSLNISKDVSECESDNSKASESFVEKGDHGSVSSSQSSPSPIKKKRKLKTSWQKGIMKKRPNTKKYKMSDNPDDDSATETVDSEVPSLDHGDVRTSDNYQDGQSVDELQSHAHLSGCSDVEMQELPLSSRLQNVSSQNIEVEDLIVKAVPKLTNYHEDLDYVVATGTDRISCKICNFCGKGIVSHYVLNHPSEEVLVSRFPRSLADSVKKEATTLPKDLKSLITEYAVKKRTLLELKCRLCSEVSSTSGRLFEHVTSHTGEYRYSCIQCNFRAPFRSSIKSHRHRHNNASMKDLCCVVIKEMPPPMKILFGYLCSECNYFQLLESNLTKHLKLHHSQQPSAQAIRVSLSQEIPPKTEVSNLFLFYFIFSDCFLTLICKYLSIHFFSAPLLKLRTQMRKKSNQKKQQIPNVKMRGMNYHQRELELKNFQLILLLLGTLFPQVI